MADADHLEAGEVRAVTGRIGGHWFERFVGPPGPAVADPGLMRTDGGCWHLAKAALVRPDVGSPDPPYHHV
jgi:hypothetical protein